MLPFAKMGPRVNQGSGVVTDEAQMRWIAFAFIARRLLMERHASEKKGGPQPIKYPPLDWMY